MTAARTMLPVAGLLVVAGAYTAWASGEQPFTDTAYLAVSVPSVLFVVMLVPSLARAVGARTQTRLVPDAPRAHSRAHPGSAVAWLAVIALLVAVELAAYFHGGPRSAYPTISSGLASLFRSRGAEAAGWYAWLAAGWYLVRR